MDGLEIVQALCRLALGHRTEEDTTRIQAFLDETAKAAKEEQEFDASH